MRILALLLLLIPEISPGKNAVILFPGLPESVPAEISVFADEPLELVCHIPVDSGATPPRSEILLASSGLAAPMQLGVEWKPRLPEPMANTLYQTFTAELALPQTGKPFELLLRTFIVTASDHKVMNTLSLHIEPRKLVDSFRAITDGRTLWVEAEWTSMQNWLKTTDIAFEILPASAVAFREGDLLFARVPPEEPARSREFESVADCPEQFWVSHVTNGPTKLILKKDPTSTKIILFTKEPLHFPPSTPAEESLILEALESFLEPQP